MSMDDEVPHDIPEGVAIIGFAGRYPGAADALEERARKRRQAQRRPTRP